MDKFSSSAKEAPLCAGGGLIIGFFYYLFIYLFIFCPEGNKAGKVTVHRNKK